MKRIAAVLTLGLLSPLIAEYLSGSMSFAELAALPVMAAMYGGGTVLIREGVRRSGRGWPSILLLGLAYGLVEEGIADQSLFNPHFLGLHLLDPGFIPTLGIGVPWTIYVLAIHVIWSIAVPIALAETLFASRARWLGPVGLTIAALIYAAGVTAIALHFAQTFFASPAQLAATAIAVVALVALALALPRLRPTNPGPAPSPWRAGLVGFVATSALVQLFGLGPRFCPWELVAGGMVLLLALLLAFATRMRTPAQSYALAAGALLTYCWTGFFSEISLHGPAMLWAHALLAAAILALTLLAGRRARLR